MKHLFPLVILMLSATRLPAEETIRMVEIEAQFVRATNEQMKGALTPKQRVMDGELSSAEVVAAIQKLKEAGAEVFGNLRAVTITGRMARVDSVSELRFPTEWDREKGGTERIFPTNFDTVDIGVKMECEPKAEADGRLSVKVLASVSEFEGFIDYTHEPSEAKGQLTEVLQQPLGQGGAWTPVISLMRVETQLLVSPGSTQMLGGLRLVNFRTKNPPKDSDPRIFIFFTMREISPR